MVTLAFCEYVFYATYSMESNTQPPTRATETISYIYPHRIAPIPRDMVQVANELGWDLHNRVLDDGQTRGVAQRKVPVDPGIAERVDVARFESERREVVFGGYTVRVVAELPMRHEDLVALRGVEKAVLPKKRPSRERKKPEAARVSIAEFGEVYQDVIQRILQPEGEIADELGISLSTTHARIGKMREEMALTKMGVVCHALKAEKVDLSGLPETSTEGVSNLQIKYVLGQGFEGRGHSRQWQGICRALGVTTKYQAFAMLVRDKRVDLDKII